MCSAINNNKGWIKFKLKNIQNKLKLKNFVKYYTLQEKKTMLQTGWIMFLGKCDFQRKINQIFQNYTWLKTKNSIWNNSSNIALSHKVLLL